MIVLSVSVRGHDAAGLTVENFWGGTAGNWNREVVKMDEMEIMVVSIKE